MFLMVRDFWRGVNVNHQEVARVDSVSVRACVA